MQSETQRLRALCSLIVDCPHSTPVWTESGYIVIRNQNIKGGRLDLSSPSFTDAEHFAHRIRRAKPTAGDIIFTREAPMGEVCMVPPKLECCVGQRQVLLRPNPKEVDGRFLLYALQSPQVQYEISWSEGTGSTVSNVRIPVLEALRIPTPDLNTQREIGLLLGTLDDRIDLLRQTNATLESIAQALFKSWFIDFDPVRAKAEGREPEGMDAATAALFPAEFTESELGLIPRGWRASKLGDVFRITMGQSPPGETYNETGAGLPFYQGRADFGFRFPDVRVHCTAPTRHARVGDVLVSVRAPVGDVNVALEACAIGRGVAAVGLDSAPSFALYSMKALRHRFKEYESHGTVFGSINKKQFEALPCVIPSAEVLAAFAFTAAVFDDRVRVNELQLRSLTQIRDSLLPRLIAGKLRLPEVQQRTEDARA